MHRPLKVATLIAVALAFTACTDSVSRGITEPDGFRPTHLSESVSPTADAIFHTAEGLLNELYACAGDKQIANKNNDLNDIGTAAAAGKWDQVVAGVARLIKATDGLIAKTKEPNITASCPPYYANATERAALREQVVHWLNLFANPGGYPNDGDITAFVCETGEDCEETGAGWKVKIPDGTFDGDVVVLVQPNGGSFPGPYRQVGNSWKFDVLTQFQANNPWTRYICWEGDFPGEENEGDVNETHIVMVRQNDDETLDYLPTIVEHWGFDTCTQYEPEEGPILLLNSAYKLLAGLPLFPKALDAYSPPRTFGGTSTASSPHWLAVSPPPGEIGDDDLAALCAKTYSYSPSTANAACTHLDRAATSQTDANWNSALDSYIGVIDAQAGKSDLSVGEANDLICDANALKRPPGTTAGWSCPYIPPIS